MQFEFATAGRIVFVPGAAKKALPETAKAMGGRPLLVDGSGDSRWAANSSWFAPLAFSVSGSKAVIARTPGYSYFLRSHDEDGIDLVFYAVPPHRLPKRA